MIYFIHCPDTATVKIGFATNPMKRFGKVQSDNASVLTLLAIEEGDRDREAELHSQFALIRKRGEWFDYAPTLQAYIGTLKPFEKPRVRKLMGGKLGQWLYDNDVTLEAFAEEVGCSRSTLSNLCAGKQTPRYGLMGRIAHATHGAVRPNDWFPDVMQWLAQDEAA